MKTKVSADIEFSRAVRAAGKALPGKKLQAAANPPDPKKYDPDKYPTFDLIRRLRSSKQGLGPGECELLADLLAGEFCQIGRPTTPLAISKPYWAMIAEAKEDARERIRTEQKEGDAWEQVAEHFARDKRAHGKSPNTILWHMRRARSPFFGR